MTAVVFASQSEAEPFLRSYQRGRFESLTEGEWRADDDIVACLTGMGKIKATLHVERMLQSTSVDRILHVGVCSSLSDEFEAGTPVAASHVMEGDRVELAAPAYPRMPLAVPFDSLEEAILVTQEHTVDGEDEQSYWQRIADISDMTGYAVAYVAATHGVPCHIIKVVTGTLNEDTDDFQKYLREAKEKAAEIAISAINKWREEDA